MKEKEELLEAATEVYTLGLAVEAAREKVRALAAEDQPCDRPEMAAARQNRSETKMAPCFQICHSEEGAARRRIFP